MDTLVVSYREADLIKPHSQRDVWAYWLGYYIAAFSRNSDVTYVSWRLQSQTTHLFVQQLVQAFNK